MKYNKAIPYGGDKGRYKGKEAIFFATHFSFCHSFLVPAIRPYLTSGLYGVDAEVRYPVEAGCEIVPLQAETHSRTVTQ